MEKMAAQLTLEQLQQIQTLSENVATTSATMKILLLLTIVNLLIGIRLVLGQFRIARNQVASLGDGKR